MSLMRLNEATPEVAQQLFRQCCTSEAWIRALVADRPYANASALSTAANVAWQSLTDADYLEAFEGHPQIGDVSTLKARYADTKALAAGEQSGVDSASDVVIEALARGNRQYLEKFGFIFIVCASGKSADEMLELLEQRLPNERDEELAIAAEEQRKIFQLRLEKLL